MITQQQSAQSPASSHAAPSQEEIKTSWSADDYVKRVLIRSSDDVVKRVLSGKLISLKEAAKLFPPGRNGKHVHVSSITRYILRGVDGELLGAVRWGSRWITSKEEVERFVAALTTRQLAKSGVRCDGARATSLAQQRHQERVDAQLDALGV
jgi:hypothetical protein